MGCISSQQALRAGHLEARAKAARCDYYDDDQDNTTACGDYTDEVRSEFTHPSLQESTPRTTRSFPTSVEVTPRSLVTSSVVDHRRARKVEVAEEVHMVHEQSNAKKGFRRSVTFGEVEIMTYKMSHRNSEERRLRRQQTAPPCGLFREPGWGDMDV